MAVTTAPRGVALRRLSSSLCRASWSPVPGATGYVLESSPVPGSLVPADETVLPGEHTAGSLLVSAGIFAHACLLTYAGWQYAGYYTADQTTPSTRRITLARRDLTDPAAPGAWEWFQFLDYAQTADDGHNIVSLGASGDGRLHVAYDHHSSTLKHRVATLDILSAPSSHTWGSALFSAQQTALGGSGTITGVTYPCYSTAPDGTLAFTFRIGSSSAGTQRLFTYAAGTWTDRGTALDGLGERAPYLHGCRWDRASRLHLVWSWRDTGSPATQHDLHHAFSRDKGATWRSTNDASLAKPVTGQNGRIFEIPQGSDAINQEGMTIDPRGRVHVQARDALEGSRRHVHYVRETDGTWHRHPLTSLPYAGRAAIVSDFAGHLIIPAGSTRLLRAAGSVRSPGWKTVSTVDHGRFQNEAYPDRAITDGVLHLLVKRASPPALLVRSYQAVQRLTSEETSLEFEAAGPAAVRVRGVDATTQGPWSEPEQARATPREQVLHQPA